MSRVKGGTTTHARHKKVIKAAKGYYGRRKNTFKVARQAVDKANQYATRDRKNRKRNFRALWIQRINAAARMHGMTYSQMMGGLIKAGIGDLCLDLLERHKLLHMNEQHFAPHPRRCFPFGEPVVEQDKERGTYGTD